MNQAPLRAGVAVVSGVLIMGASALLGAAWAVTVALGGGVDESGVYGALGLMGLVMGLGLLRTGLGRDSARPSALLGVTGPGPWIIAFALCLGIGQLLLLSRLPLLAAAFPLIQFLTVLCAALAVMSTVTWRAGGEPVRAVWSGLAYGGCLAASLALVFEAFALAATAAAVWWVARAQGWSDALIEAGAKAVEAAQGGPPLDADLLANLVLRPAVIVAAFGLLGVAGPLGEELSKAFGVWARRPATRYRAWLWGTAAGAGFGMTEAIALGALVLDQWAVGMMVRAAALIMHATMAGLAGLGWHAAFVERRGAHGLALFLAAAGGHMLWNTLVLAAVVFGALAVRDEDALWALAASTAAVVLVATFTAVLLLFRWLANRLGRESTPAEPL